MQELGSSLREGWGGEGIPACNIFPPTYSYRKNRESCVLQMCHVGVYFGFKLSEKRCDLGIEFLHFFSPIAIRRK